MIRVWSYSEAGGHPENEDAFAVQPHPSAPDCFLCAVADGQGGQAGGGPAARTACQAFLDAAARLPVEKLLQPRTWPTLLQSADRAVADDPESGFTTLAAFSLTPGQLCGASSGDSAVVARGSGDGIILTGRQYKNPPVGSGAAPFVPFTSRLVSPWSVLACTDGVWKYAGWEGLLQFPSEWNGEAIIDRLREGARLRSGGFPDDFTLIVLQDDPA
jgi:hypothetical protein